MSYQRKCENWLNNFLLWTGDRSVAPFSVLTLCGLFCLSSSLRRHVKVGKKYLGGWECFPHLYVTFVAPPGVITKSTSIRFAENLIKQLPQIRRTPTVLSVAAFAEELKKSPDGTLSLIIPEFGTAIDKAGTDFYTIMTDLFDGSSSYHETTIGRGDIKVDNPLANLMTATTPEWLAENVSHGILNGGYGSRNLWICENKPRHRRLLHSLYKTEEHDYDKIEADLVSDLDYIAENIHGEFTFEPDAEQFFEKWYIDSEMNSTGHRRILGWEQRKPAYVMKIAMLLTICTQDELILTKDILLQSLGLINGFEINMLQAFNLLGKNKYTADIHSILAYMVDQKQVSQEQLYEEFMSLAEPRILDQLIGGLETMGKIRKVMIEGKSFIVLC